MLNNYEIASNKNIFRYSLMITAFLAIMAVSAINSFAQQTIFNVPSANTLQQGRTHLELTSGFRTDADNRYSSFLPKVSVGLGNGLELSSGVLNVEGGRLDDTTTLQLGGKWRFYDNEEKGTSFQVTTLLNVPLRTSQGMNFDVIVPKGKFLTRDLTLIPGDPPEKASALVFAGAHQKLGTVGTRLAAGFYNGTARALANDNVTGAWLSVEQPITRNVNFIADWMSGDHRLGAFTPGASINLGKHNIKVGYQFSNVEKSNNAWVMRYGITF